MSAWAKPGVRCVCVARCFDFRTDIDYGYVEVGGIYKIVRTSTNAGWDGLLLGLWGTPLDTWFDVDAFRPLVTPEQFAEEDAETFRHIARHARAPEGADA